MKEHVEMIQRVTLESADVIANALKKPYEKIIMTYFENLVEIWGELNLEEKKSIAQAMSVDHKLSQFLELLEKLHRTKKDFK